MKDQGQYTPQTGYIHTRLDACAAQEEARIKYREHARDFNSVGGTTASGTLDAPDTLPTSPFYRVNLAANEVAALAYRIEELVARLVGPQPEEACDKCAAASRPGHLHDMGTTADNIIENVNRMQRVLSALERMLP